jgi:hypothetical protein
MRFAFTFGVVAMACTPDVSGTLLKPLEDGPGCADPVSPAPDGRAASVESLRWDLSPGCVPVTFDPELTSIETQIRAAVADWNSVPCAHLCLAEPSAATITEEVPRCRIHIAAPSHVPPGLTGLGGSVPILAVTQYNELSGMILGSRLQVFDLSPEPDLERVLTHSLGHALGLNSTDSSTASSISADVPDLWPASGISDLDRTRVLEKYGRRASCP